MNLVTVPLTLDADVRHLGPDDILNSVSISNITRALAARDTSINNKLSGLIQDLKNSVLATPVMLPRTSIQAFGTAWIGNVRIPKGYQATIIDAAVSSDPVAKQGQLLVIHSAGTYGQNGSGNGVTQLVSTLDEYNANGDFVGEGELIFKVVSSATRRIAVSASVLVVLLPI
jgi:hypothetical protein